MSGGAFGVFLAGGSGTVDNAGTISGASYSVKLSDTGVNRLIVEPSAVFIGAVGGGASANSTLELAGGTGSISSLSGGSGTVTQNGQSWSFFQFGSLAFDTGSNWRLDGTGSAATLGNNGVVDVRGALNITTAIDPASTGLFTIENGASLEVASVFGGGTQMQFMSSSSLVIDAAGSFGAGVGSASYNGPLLEGFGAGDTVDIKDFSPAGSTFSYDGTTGMLQLFNGASQAANLRFSDSSLGGGSFQVAGDGGSGVLVTHG